jgi:phospholipid/cholesterol/gamma-HCH transport system substrate-binding protein
LAQDRKPIGDAIQSLGGLATTTAGLLSDAREPLKQDIAALGGLTKNLNDSEALVEHFIQFLPQKVSTLTTTADYGSWFNFFLCEATGEVAAPPLVPPKQISLPLLPVNRARCGA